MPESGTTLDTRLAALADHDQQSAAFIRQALEEADGPPAPARPQHAPDAIAAWRNEGDGSMPDIAALLGSDATTPGLLAALPEETCCMLLEAEPARAAALFLSCPLERLVAEGRLSMALGNNRELVIKQFLKRFRLTNSPSIKIVFAEDNTQESEAFYLSIMREIRKGIHLNVFNLNTMIFCGPQWQFNTLRNLPHLLANPGINTINQLFPGKPAVIVGAGPSLTSVIPYLREAAKGFVVVSTGTALRPLRAAGIRPDLVVSVDASVKTGPQFETRCDDLFLCCSSFAHPPILPLFRGLFGAQLPTSPIDQWLNELNMARGFLVAAGTVTTTALDLAKQMGCDPIITVGFDLSFSDDGVTHASRTMYDGHRRNPKTLSRVPGNYQETVLTTEQFRCYLSLAEEYVERHQDVSYINLTNAGAHIEGMRLMPPEALPTLAAQPFNAYEAIAETHAGFQTDDCENIQPELSKISLQLQEISHNAHLGAMTCNQLIMMLRSPCDGDEETARAHLETLSEIDRKFGEAGEMNAILEMSLWPVSYRTAASTPESGNARADAIASNRQSREFYEQIAGAAKWTRHLVDSALQMLEKRQAGLKPETVSESETQTADAENALQFQ